MGNSSLSPWITWSWSREGNCHLSWCSLRMCSTTSLVVRQLWSTPLNWCLVFDPLGRHPIACILRSFFFFFSLFHQRADDEALTRFLQTSLFLVASPILVKSMFLSFRSSLTLSIQVFLCLSLLLFPSTCPCKAAFGNLFSSVLSTCPNHCSLLSFS